MWTQMKNVNKQSKAKYRPTDKCAVYKVVSLAFKSKLKPKSSLP